MAKHYTIGLDYGTDSVRAVLVDTENGDNLNSQVHWYVRWKEGKFCRAADNQFRQHPLDHLEGLEKTITGVLRDSGVDPSLVKGICVDTTGSSPLPVDAQGQALALTEGFEENPHAMVVLWKDHTAIAEAKAINQLARSWGGVDYTQYEGGIYSSEWFWAKILHIVRTDPAVAAAAHSWMEHCDWITLALIGSQALDTFKRSRCAAGHKAMWHESWGGLPSEDFLSQLDPALAALRSRLYEETYTSDQVAGTLSADWAERLGLSTDVKIAVGTFDAHAGAIGGEIEEHAIVKVMGTSTCDIMVATPDTLGDRLVPGICGQVDGSVIPGMIGLEAGQSAFGDLLAWFRDMLYWPVENMLRKSQWLDDATRTKLTEELHDNLVVELSEAAEQVPLSETGIVALDWVNGRRTPDANQALKGAMMGLGMGSSAPQVFRALVEAICFGAKKINERFEQEGVKINTVIGIGGVARKSTFVMQTLANVLDMPIKIARSDQAPALGAAIYAAVVAGIYPDVLTAKQAMSSGFEKTYYPEPAATDTYQKLYQRYQQLGDFVETQTTVTEE